MLMLRSQHQAQAEQQMESIADEKHKDTVTEFIQCRQKNSANATNELQVPGS